MLAAHVRPSYDLFCCLDLLLSRKKHKNITGWLCGVNLQNGDDAGVEVVSFRGFCVIWTKQSNNTRKQNELRSLSRRHPSCASMHM